MPLRDDRPCSCQLHRNRLNESSRGAQVTSKSILSQRFYFNSFIHVWNRTYIEGCVGDPHGEVCDVHAEAQLRRSAMSGSQAVVWRVTRQPPRLLRHLRRVRQRQRDGMLGHKPYLQFVATNDFTHHQIVRSVVAALRCQARHRSCFLEYDFMGVQ